jgi:ABC-2 type transport system permease protein
MRNMLLIARREYLEQIRGRAFRISTILVPLLMVFLLGISAFTGNRIGRGRHLVVAADNPQLAADIRSNLAGEESGIRVETVAPFTAQDHANLMAQIGNKSIDGLLTVENSAGDPRVSFTSQSSTDLMDTTRIEVAINFAFLNLRLAAHGLQPGEVQALYQSVHLEKKQFTGDGKTGKSQGMMPFYKAMLVTFLMTMPILLYGMDMARSIVEEKSSRIFEVMLSVTRADDMLAGKLLGVGAVGMTQIAIWIAAGVLLSGTALMAPLMSGGAAIHFTLLEGLLFPIYFVLGFFLYSAFFSGLAATCETSQDLQMYLSLAIIPTWLSFAVLPFLLNDPNSPWVAAASIFPLTAPLVMVPRIGMLTAPYPYWQIALSLVLLVLSIWGVLWVSSRLYRIGILMYGKRATLPELLRWIRSS